MPPEELFPNPLNNPDFFTDEEDAAQIGGTTFRPTSSVEEALSAAEQGQVPFADINTEMEDLQTVQIPTERREEAIQQFVDARINQARQEAETAQSLEDRATAQLAGNTFGPALFQALTGARFGTGQQQAQARQRAAVEEAMRAAGAAESAEDLLSAQGQQQIAQLEAETGETERQINREIEQVNREREQAQLESAANQISTIGEIVQGQQQLEQEQIQTLRDRSQNIEENLLDLGTPEDFQKRIGLINDDIQALQQQKKEIQNNESILPEERAQQLREINQDISRRKNDRIEAQTKKRLSQSLRNDLQTVNTRLNRMAGIEPQDTESQREGQDVNSFLDQMLGDQIDTSLDRERGPTGQLQPPEQDRQQDQEVTQDDTVAVDRSLDEIIEEERAASEPKEERQGLTGDNVSTLLDRSERLRDEIRRIQETIDEVGESERLDTELEERKSELETISEGLRQSSRESAGSALEQIRDMLAPLFESAEENPASSRF